MTKNQRKEIYWAAMFEIVAFGTKLPDAIDLAAGVFTFWSELPELLSNWEITDPLMRLSKAIHVCEK